MIKIREVNEIRRIRKVIVTVASKNPVKIKAAKNGFQRMIPLINDEKKDGAAKEEEGIKEEIIIETVPVSVSSGVSEQPLTEEETFRGAKTRAENAMKENPDSDFWIGMEGGVAKERIRDDEEKEELMAFAWIYIIGKTDDKLMRGAAKTASFQLPPIVAERVMGGEELGPVNDEIFKEENSKQKGGALGLLTKGVITRAEEYQIAVELALIPFINKNFYK